MKSPVYFPFFVAGVESLHELHYGAVSISIFIGMTELILISCTIDVHLDNRSPLKPIMKTSLFKYTENFATKKKMKFFR